MSAISDAMSLLKNAAKANKFRVECPVLPDTMKILCKSTAIGGKDFGVIEKRYLGEPLKLRGDVTYADLSLTFDMIEGDALYTAIELWQTTGIPAVLSVFHLNALNEDMLQYDYLYAWPSSITPIEVGTESSDTISEYSVTITYNSHIRIQ